MRPTLLPGIEYNFRYRIPENRVVKALLPESDEFQEMPQVLATGFMVGIVEWACIQAINPHLDWPVEQTVGVYVDLSHDAATPPGLELEINVRLVSVEGKRLTFEIEANDGVDIISKGRHKRFVIDAEKFNKKVRDKEIAVKCMCPSGSQYFFPD